ncbi:hypothetical protein PGTUg99_007509 [Puccinia graminis f. sp. tritici]|uniref:Uncharacterized protein n=1 Tax=Puccinia graminis f. sp. tritici TaxID=56615 RepID=A0A5B0S6H7_PUCGR|nr:hypothetical protein PGTUg99_007509 [Puccinia graminis f. sp. tritici]
MRPPQLETCDKFGDSPSINLQSTAAGSMVRKRKSFTSVGHPDLSAAGSPVER